MSADVLAALGRIEILLASIDERLERAEGITKTRTFERQMLDEEVADLRRSVTRERRAATVAAVKDAMRRGDVSANGARAANNLPPMAG